METHARFVLIGAFTLAGIFGIMATIMWFANVEFGRQFAYYVIDFASVSGLSNASDVRFNGLPVGQVLDLSIAPDGSGLIRARIEVEADTPIRTDSIATITAQGITGVAFVGLSAGNPMSPLLRDASDMDVPLIPSERSIIQRLYDEAPQFLEDAGNIVRQLSAMFGEEGETPVPVILSNLETASVQVQELLDDLSGLADAVEDRLDGFDAAITTGTEAFASADRAFNSADELIRDQIADIAVELKDTLDRLGVVVDQVSEDLPTISENLVSASESADAAFDNLDKAVAAARGPIQSFAAEGLPEYERLAREARDLVQSLDRVIRDIERDRGRYFLKEEEPLYRR